MKIIAHTAYGYMAELSPKEVAAITGNGDDDKHASHGSYHRNGYSHPIGTELRVNDAWKHLQDLLQNEQSRKRIAESLRAAATLIEHTPSPINPPATDPPA